MKFVSIAVMLVLAASSGAQPLSSPPAAVDCRAGLTQRLQTDLGLAYQQFDQTEGGGFRALAQIGCYREAEQLIVRYLERVSAQQRAMWWHAAQMAASAGDYPLAAAHARRSLDDTGSAARSQLMWDDYVRASIAFFERDRAGLQRHRDAIAAKGRDFLGNRMNQNLLDAMLSNFERGYAEIGNIAADAWEKAASRQN